MATNSDETLQQTITSVEAAQNLDPQMIARTETLGRSFDLSPAVPAVRRTVEFFQQVPLRYLVELPDEQKKVLAQQADQFFQLYQNLMTFDPANVANAASERESLINQASGVYTTVFSNAFQIVAYLSTRERDVAAIEREARTAVEAAKKQADDLTRDLQETNSEAQRILGEVRKTAAEAGVSKEAIHFGGQADLHNGAAWWWQIYTLAAAVLLVIFAAVSVLAGRQFLQPENTYEALQLALSKVLIFSTIAYVLFLCARTLLAHRHNEIVNRHRQNALLTFNSLAEAASSEQTREVVLTHASACIFEPQESGFSKQGSNQPGPSLIEVLPRIAGSQQPAS